VVGAGADEGGALAGGAGGGGAAAAAGATGGADTACGSTFGWRPRRGRAGSRPECSSHSLSSWFKTSTLDGTGDISDEDAGVMRSRSWGLTANATQNATPPVSSIATISREGILTLLSRQA
jgi:hypothetical protein